MKLLCKVVNSLADVVEPAECRIEKEIVHPSMDTVQLIFPGCDVYVWNSTALRWKELKDDNAGSLLHEEARLMVHSKSRPLVQDSNNFTAYAKVKVKGPSGWFDAFLLADSGCSLELVLSSYKASQIGLSRVVANQCAETANKSIGITLRGSAEVAVYLPENGVETKTSPAYLEVWTLDGTADPKTPAALPSQNASAATAQPSPLSPQLPPVAIQFQEMSLVMKGKDRFNNDIILGRPGMIKLGISVTANGDLCKCKRIFKIK